MRIVKSDDTVLYSKPFFSKSVAYYDSVSAEETSKIQNSSACFEVNFSNISDNFDVTETLEKDTNIKNPNSIENLNSIVENRIVNETDFPLENVDSNNEFINSASEPSHVNYGIIIAGCTLGAFTAIIVCIIFIRKH